MYQQEYYVPKSSGTLSDALLAYGLAVVLQQLLPNNRKHRAGSVRIKDRDSHYVVVLPQVLQEQWLEENADRVKGLAYAIKNKQDIAEGVPIIDYNEHWEDIHKQTEQQKSAKQNKSKNNHSELQNRANQQVMQEFQESFHRQPYRNIALMIGDYRMQVEGIHNKAVSQWYKTIEAGYAAANLRTILMLFAQPQTDIKVIEKTWKSEVKQKDIEIRLSASQVFNPNRGKGINHTKANNSKAKEQKEFWILLYLKAVGLFTAAASYIFIDENEKKKPRKNDIRKNYVLAPINIELSSHKKIFESYFEPTFYGFKASPIKADVMALLKYTNAYLSYSREAKSDDLGEIDRNPKNSIRGFYVTTYKLLSVHSFTMLNLSFLGLPLWLHQIKTMNDAIAVQQVVQEYEKIIQPLEENLQEGHSLLSSYRDFLAGNQLDAFFDFCAVYGEYVVHTLRTQSKTQHKVKQYSIKSLDEIFRRISMSEQDTTNPDDLTEFSSSSGKHPGFHRIAYAIWRSTVKPQRQNSNYKSGQAPEKSLYEVRYGLGNNLRRKANSAPEFMDALTEFVQIYNAETEQIYERTSEERRNHMRDLQDYRKSHYRSTVCGHDLDDVLELVKKYGPHLVCNMLVAYGYGTGGQSTKDNDSQATINDNEGEE